MRQNPYLAELVEDCRIREHDDDRNYSQVVVAARLGVSLETYRSIEQGIITNRRGGAVLLHRLADDLGMTEGERRSLFELSGLSVPQSDDYEDGNDDLETTCHLIMRLQEAAVVTDHRSNIVFFNRTFALLFPNVTGADNMMRWVLTSPQAREELINWTEDWGRPALRVLKTRAAETGDPRAVALYRDLAKSFDGEPPVGKHAPPQRAVRKLVDGNVVALRLRTYLPVAEVPPDFSITVFELVVDQPEPIFTKRRSKLAKRTQAKLIGGQWHNGTVAIRRYP